MLEAWIGRLATCGDFSTAQGFWRAFLPQPLRGAGGARRPAQSADSKLAARVQQANRLTWGATPALIGSEDAAAFPANAALPPPPAAAQAQIDSLRISREPMASIVMAMDAQRRANAQITDPAQKDAAQRPGSRR
jgi:hypothetical protein